MYTCCHVFLLLLLCVLLSCCYCCCCCSSAAACCCCSSSCAESHNVLLFCMMASDSSVLFIIQMRLILIYPSAVAYTASICLYVCREDNVDHVVSAIIIDKILKQVLSRKRLRSRKGPPLGALICWTCLTLLAPPDPESIAA